MSRNKKGKDRNKKETKMEENSKAEETLSEEEGEKSEAEEKAEPSEEKAEEKDKDLIFKQMQSQIAELEKEIEKLKDERLREAAETDNLRKRLRAEKERGIESANEAIIKDLLEPLNNFALAIENSNTSDVESYKKGVEIVEEQMLSMLKNNWGVEVIGEAGAPFDPNEMEALSLIEKEGVEKEVVDTVYSKGFRFRGKVLKPAKVVVAKPLKEKQEEDINVDKENS